MKNEIILFEENELKLEVNLQDDTVWLTQKQMSELFGKDQSVISRHIINIINEGELDKSNMQKMHIPNSDKLVAIYNLDMIISVGYRVKSKRGIQFRIWATKILKDYLIKGYSVNQKRLEYLEKTIQIIDIATRLDKEVDTSDAKEILRVISKYTKALDLLDNYDYKNIEKPKGTKSNKKINYEECINIINVLKFNEKSNLFALEKDKGLDSIINNIYQTYNGVDLYSSIEEKASNFLYLIVKDHTFIDGNKRIGATLFIYFLQYYGILMKEEKLVIDNNTLVALTILIAQSNPNEKDIIVELVMNFIN